ncbi:hypothetical protein EW093_09755 [Thiospirochaeta perfilievii]|uniref:Uridine kinase n=1 Tax=Thiospirochaeta perfilievii TaxID=252967 RepID=A0A5C1QD37_9SPIO|nr:hypothetical protein [Thiospirochaeta perfilievii]QEN04980.1 hypothetical protein EW093_09755 [Thiospirochaeta perfilievii]
MLIAISGFGGSGKSTYAQKLSIELGAPIIGVDSFCKDTKLTNYNLWNIMDYKRLEKEILKPYSNGFKILTYGVFSWNENRIINKTTVSFKDSIIVEGVGLFRPELLKYFTKKIWIDTNLEESIKRGQKRDEEEYGLEPNPEWNNIWKQNDLECFKKYKPLDIADEIIQL